jgi:hypothetical protein
MSKPNGNFKSPLWLLESILYDRNSSSREDLQGLLPLNTVVLPGKSPSLWTKFLRLDAFVRMEFIFQFYHLQGMKLSESQKLRTERGPTH